MQEETVVDAFWTSNSMTHEPRVWFAMIYVADSLMWPAPCDAASASTGSRKMRAEKLSAGWRRWGSLRFAGKSPMTKPSSVGFPVISRW